MVLLYRFYCIFVYHVSLLIILDLYFASCSWAAVMSLIALFVQLVYCHVWNIFVFYERIKWFDLICRLKSNILCRRRKNYDASTWRRRRRVSKNVRTRRTFNKKSSDLLTSYNAHWNSGSMFLLKNWSISGALRYKVRPEPSQDRAYTNKLTRKQNHDWKQNDRWSNSIALVPIKTE